MAMATVSLRRRAVPVLVLVLVLVPCAAVAAGEGVDPMHQALFDHIQEIRALTEEAASAHGEVDVEQSGGDWIGSLGVVEETGGVVEDQVVREGDGASDLLAHIYEVRRQVEEAVKGEESESVAVEGGLVDGDEQREKEVEVEVEDDGVVDPVVQERFRVLEAALKSLKVESDGEVMEFRVQGAEDGAVADLLEHYAREANLKLHSNGPASRDSHVENDSSHGLGEDEGDHGKLFGHGDGDAHASASFCAARDAHYHEHDHDGHSRRHQRGERINEKRFLEAEEIAEEEDLLQDGVEGPVDSNAEQPRGAQNLCPSSPLSVSACNLVD